jgi:type IX secretion system PorP/SprF family membrane protein
MMRGLIFLVFLFSIPLAHSQQLPQYTQWNWHQFATNPAHAGIKKCIDIHSLYRIQWVGFEGAPKSGFLTIAIPLDSRRRRYLSARHGFGFKFETDEIGDFSTQRFNVAYAAHFNFNKTDRLSLGLYAGFVQMGYDPEGVTTTLPDPSVQNQGSIFAPDASFGAWYNSENYFVGLSLQNLFRSDWNSIGTDARYRTHAVLNGGYRLEVNNNITLLPGLQVKLPPKGPISADLILQTDFNNVLGLGIGYRNTDALLLFVQLKLKGQLSIGYSFDYTLSSIQLGAKNTHEVPLRFTSCKKRNVSTSSCPLFE